MASKPMAAASKPAQYFAQLASAMLNFMFRFECQGSPHMSMLATMVRCNSMYTERDVEILTD